MISHMCPRYSILSSSCAGRACNISVRCFSTVEETGKKRVLSGIQPTGKLHIGNYAGALKQWVDNQHKYDNYFCVVDLHAITNNHDKNRLRRESIEAAAMYIAAGIDANSSCIFMQSHVPAHTELTWLLNCITPMSWLGRMIQYKEKSKGNEESACVGLFDYPVLMAADILLYQAQLVPVGEDQRQHLELTREICRRFNDQFPMATTLSPGRKHVFQEPEALVLPAGARLMSLIDGTSKMSKSHESDGSRINLLDPPDIISKKIKRCKTDNVDRPMTFTDPSRPECRNLLNIYQTMSGKCKDDIETEVAEMRWGKFKPLLTDAIVEHLAPMQKEYKQLMQDESYIEGVLKEGRFKASATANESLIKAKDAMGFYI